MAGSDTLLLTARAEIYRCLSLTFADPQAGTAHTLTRQWPITVTALDVLGIASIEAADVARDIADGALSDENLVVAHAACFGHAVSKDCPPYEAEYGQAHIFEKTQTLADIAGFYRAFGLEPAVAIPDRADHIAFELEFMEFLCRKQAFALVNGHPPDRIEQCQGARRAFLEAHLGRWGFSFAHHLIRKESDCVLAPWVRLFEAFLAAELNSMGIERRADPFLNEGDIDRVEDTACSACPIMQGVAPQPEEVRP